MKNILKKLNAIQCELKCNKDKQAQSYKYRSAEDILENLKPILAAIDCTLLISDDVEMIWMDTYYKSTITLYDFETEESISNHSYVKEWSNIWTRKDWTTYEKMSEWQYSWATISYCRKYALCGMFAIDDWEDLDSVEDKKTEKKAETPKERLQEMNREEAPKTLKRFFEHIDKVSPDNKNELKRLLEQGRFLYKSEYYSDEEKQKIQEVSLWIKDLLESKNENKWQ